MSPRAPRKCARFDCEVRVTGKRYCPEHVPAWQTSTRPGSTRASRALRAQVLRRDPVCTCDGCQRCTPGGCVRTSTEDDHAINLKADGSDTIENHRGMCSACHLVKTLTEAQAGRA